MRIAVDKKNHRVIATGTYKGKNIKAIAVCSPDDVFDVEKGKKIATLRYSVKEREARLNYHKSNIKVLNEHKKWVEKVLADETEIVKNMSDKLNVLKSDVLSEINNIVK